MRTAPIAATTPSAPSADWSADAASGGDLVAHLARCGPLALAVCRLPEHVVVDANDAFLALVEARYGDVVGHPAADFGLPLPPRTQPDAAPDGAAVWTVAVSLRRRSGEPRSTVASMHAAVVDGVPHLVAHLVETDHAGDVPPGTEPVRAAGRQRTERALRESEARLRLALDSAAMGTWSWDLITDEVVWSDGVGPLYGLPAGTTSISPEAFFALVHPEDRDRMRAVDRAAIAGAEHYAIEFRAVHPDGSVHWLEARGRATTRNDAGRATRLTGITMDVTARREAEARLRASEARFRTLVEELPVLVYVRPVVDPSRAAYVGPRVGDVFGFAPEESSATWVDRLHPDDRARVLADVVHADRTGKPLQLEYRERAREGRWVAVRDEAVLVRDAAGAPDYWLGVKLDVTDQRQAEAAMRQSEARFRSLIANATDLVAILDAGGRFRFESPAIQRVLGHPPSYLIGRDAFAFVHPADRADVEAEFAALVADPTRRPTITFRFRHADRSWRWLESVGTNLLADPAVGGIVVNSRDITERKEADAALRAREREARGLLAAADKQARELALLERVGSALARELDLAVLIRTVVEAAAETFGYTQVSLYLLEDDALHLQHQVGYSQVIERIPISVGVSGRVVRTGLPVLLTDVAADPTFLGAIEGIQSEVCVPLRDQGRVVGTFNLESTGGVRLTDNDLRLMVALAEHVDVAIARARLYAETRASQERFQTFMDHSPALAWIKDDAGRYTYVNRAFAAAFGGEPSKVAGKTDADLLPAARRREMRREDAAVLATGRTVEVVRSLALRGGEPREWLIYKFPLTDAVGRRYVGGTAVDTTARAQTEAALREAAAAAEAAVRLKSQFLSTVSHELRTPINAITGYAHLLEQTFDGPLTPDQAEDVRRIAAAADRLGDLINDVLDLSRIEAGGLAVEPAAVDLLPLVERVRADVAAPAAAKGLELAVDLPDGLAVLADPRRSHQLLLNLVGNAVKFTEAGRVTIRGRAAGACTVIEVADTGIGIAAEALPHIFDEFRQADGSTTRRYGGTGLGLAIARRLADLQGGRIEVASELGVGSTFTVTLPAPPRRPTSRPTPIPQTDAGTVATPLGDSTRWYS